MNEKKQIKQLISRLMEAALEKTIWYPSIRSKIIGNQEILKFSIESLDDLDYYIDDLSKMGGTIILDYKEYTKLVANYYADRGYYKNAVEVYIKHIQDFDESQKLVESGLLSPKNLICFGPYLYNALEELNSVLSDQQKIKCEYLFTFFEKDASAGEWIEFLLKMFGKDAEEMEELIQKSILADNQPQSQIIMASLGLSSLYEILFFNYECFIANAKPPLKRLANCIIRYITKTMKIFNPFLTKTVQSYTTYEGQDQIDFQFIEIPALIEEYLKDPKVQECLLENKLTASLVQHPNFLIQDFKTISCTVIIDQFGMQFGPQHLIELQENCSHEYVKKSIYKRIQHKFSKPNVFCLCFGGPEGEIKEANFDQIENEIQKGKEFNLIVYEKKSIDESQILIPVYLKGKDNDIPLTYPNIVNFDYIHDDFKSVKTKAISSIQNILAQIVSQSDIILKANFELNIVEQLEAIIGSIGIEVQLKENDTLIPETGELIDHVTNFEQLRVDFIINNTKLQEFVEDIECKRKKQDIPFLPNNELDIGETIFTQNANNPLPRFYVLHIDPLSPLILPKQCRIGSKMYNLVSSSNQKDSVIVRNIQSKEYLQNISNTLYELNSGNLSLPGEGYVLYELSSLDEEENDIIKQIETDKLKMKSNNDYFDDSDLDEFEGFEYVGEDLENYQDEEQYQVVEQNEMVQE